MRWKHKTRLRIYHIGKILIVTKNKINFNNTDIVDNNVSHTECFLFLSLTVKSMHSI